MSISVRSRKFCCCLPVRLGVVVSESSVLPFVYGFESLTIRFSRSWLWLEDPLWRLLVGFKSRNWVCLFLLFTDCYVNVSLCTQKLSTQERRAMRLPFGSNPSCSQSSVSFPFSGTFSNFRISMIVTHNLFSFVGALIKNRRMISSFAVALAIHLGFSVASGAFTLYTLFKENTQEAIARCLNDASSDANVTADTCRTGIAIVKGVMVAVYIVTWLIQLCELFSCFYHYF